MQQKVLIADSDQDLCDLYRRYLLLHGYQVEIAHDGLQCLTKLRQTRPAMLIIEFELPWGGGDGVLGCMAEEEKLCSIPVLVIHNSLLTNYSPKKENRPVHSAKKPCRLSEVLTTIHSLISTKKARPKGAGRDAYSFAGRTEPHSRNR